MPVGSKAFGECANLVYVSLSKELGEISLDAFNGSTANIEKIDVNSASLIPVFFSIFANLPNLKTVNFGKEIYGGSFSKIRSIANLINKYVAVEKLTADEVSLTNDLRHYRGLFINKIVIDDTIPCFGENTQILCADENMKEFYLPIKNIAVGQLVKTYNHGYKKVFNIESGSFVNNPQNFRTCMYAMKKNEFMTDDLLLTGGHGILVNKVDKTNIISRYDNKNSELAYLYGKGFSEKIDNKIILQAVACKYFTQCVDNNMYNYYHISLETNGKDNVQYGIWANGVLCESTANIRFLPNE